MKKHISVISVFLAMLMILSVVPVFAEATPTIVIGSATADVGDTVDIDVSLRNNPGICGYSLAIVYNDEIVRLDKVTASGEFGGRFNYAKKATWFEGFDVALDGTILTLTFTVLAAGSSEITVTYNSGDISNYDEDDVDFAVVPGAISTATAHEHEWGDWTVATPATCTAAGTETRACSGCEETESREIPATGHTWGDWTVATAATCTAAGTETRACSGCEETESRAIPATGHTWGDWTVATAATCTAAGTETRACSGCEETESREIPATGHAMTHVAAKTATLEEEGNIEHWICKTCGIYSTDENGTTVVAPESVIIPVIVPEHGDVDGDGKINARDIVTLMRYFAGWDGIELDLEQADFNGDGRLNNRDILEMLLFIVNH